MLALIFNRLTSSGTSPAHNTDSLVRASLFREHGTDSSLKKTRSSFHNTSSYLSKGGNHGLFGDGFDNKIFDDPFA